MHVRIPFAMYLYRDFFKHRILKQDRKQYLDRDTYMYKTETCNEIYIHFDLDIRIFIYVYTYQCIYIYLNMDEHLDMYHDLYLDLDQNRFLNSSPTSMRK